LFIIAQNQNVKPVDNSNPLVFFILAPKTTLSSHPHQVLGVRCQVQGSTLHL